MYIVVFSGLTKMNIVKQFFMKQAPKRILIKSFVSLKVDFPLGFFGLIFAFNS